MTDFLLQAETALRSQGGRMTAQRRLILETLARFASHPSAEDLFAAVRRQDPTLNLSTIYRTLHWLEESGLLAARWFESGRRQERFDATLSGHHHFCCRACGGISEFTDPQVDNLAAGYAARAGAQVESAQLVIYGLCAACANKDANDSASG